MLNQQNSSEENAVVLMRQPIFDVRRRLWGYEICCVTGDTASSAPEDVIVRIASSAYIGLQQILERSRKLVVPLSEKGLFDRLPYALPPSLAAVKLKEEFSSQQEILEVLKEIKSDGYLIAVEAVSGNPEWNSLYHLADVLCMSRQDGARVLENLTGDRRDQTQFLALNVSDRAGLREAQELGFHLFQGGFFKRPEDVQVRRLTSHEISRLRLLRLMGQSDPDFARLAEGLETDAALSYRLLAYMNSAAFGFQRTIKSIRQAITLLGWTSVRNWLRVALLSDIAQGPHSAELVTLAAQRGKFLELIGASFDYWGFDADSLQLLGLFSLLDVMLCLPAEELVRYLPLEEKLKAALRREPHNEYLPLLLLVELLEEAEWEEASRLVQRLGMDEKRVKECFQTSLVWADQFWNTTI